jgi:type I restriction enzyme S subunit
MHVTDFKGNEPRFVYYFLQTVNLAAHNSGSAQPSLNRNYIYPIDIAVPRPAEQRAIAALLGALDDKIELNRRMSATLEEMARALYRSWFVDFDPVHARALGQPPAHMDATTAALFPDSFGPDGLPKG